MAARRHFDSHDAADGPDVHLKAVPLLAQHLWGNVVGGPTQRLLALAIVLHFGGQAKVTWERQSMTGDALEGWGPCCGAATGGWQSNTSWPPTDLHLHVVTEEEVAQLEVPVNDTVAVQVLAAQDGLAQVVPHLGLTQRLPPLVQLQQRL